MIVRRTHWIWGDAVANYRANWICNPERTKAKVNEIFKFPTDRGYTIPDIVKPYIAMVLDEVMRIDSGEFTIEFDEGPGPRRQQRKAGGADHQRFPGRTEDDE